VSNLLHGSMVPAATGMLEELLLERARCSPTVALQLHWYCQTCWCVALQLHWYNRPCWCVALQLHWYNGPLTVLFCCAAYGTLTTL
jgi:hypothetical protein